VKAATVAPETPEPLTAVLQYACKDVIPVAGLGAAPEIATWNRLPDSGVPNSSIEPICSIAKTSFS
jgi:hypothetical protein